MRNKKDIPFLGLLILFFIFPVVCTYANSALPVCMPWEDPQLIDCSPRLLSDAEKESLILVIGTFVLFVAVFSAKVLIKIREKNGK